MSDLNDLRNRLIPPSSLRRATRRRAGDQGGGRMMQGRTFAKTVTLMTSPSARKVPMGAEKLALYLQAHTYGNVEITLSYTKQDMIRMFNELFVGVLKGASVTQIMIDVSRNLVPPNLPPDQTLNALNLKKVLGQSKYIYLLPSRELGAVTIPDSYFVQDTKSEDGDGGDDLPAISLNESGNEESTNPRGTADSDEDIEVVSEQLVGSSNRPAATGTSRRPAATRSRVSSGTGTLSVYGFTAREVQETEVSNQAATTSGNSDPPTQVAANLSLQSPSADSEDLSNEEKSILIAFNEAKRVSSRCTRPDAVKVLQAYREAVWRPDARPLDLTSTLEVIEGVTVPIMISRSDIVSSTVDEIIDADQHRVTECLDTRVPLEVSFRLEDAEDYGGPRKEFFNLFLTEVREMLTEDDNELVYIKGHFDSQLYYVYGLITGMSVIQGGPVCTVPPLKDGEHYEQYKSGLKRSGIWKLMEIKEVKQLMMTHKQKHETPSRFLRIFTTQSDAPQSSNLRKRHDQAYGLFNKYVRDVFGGNRKGVIGKITPEDILEFATGSRYEPVLGFKMKPTITFRPHEHWMPTASTCANQMYLPIPPDSTTRYPAESRLMALMDTAFSTKLFGTM